MFIIIAIITVIILAKGITVKIRIMHVIDKSVGARIMTDLTSCIVTDMTNNLNYDRFARYIKTIEEN